MTTTFSKLTLLFFASLLLETAFAQELFTSAAKMKLATKKEIMYRLPNLPKEQKITVGILDGYAIFEGDIVLYKEGQQKDAGIIGDNYRWENGVIPYVIADGHPLAADIRRAIDIMNQQTNLCIRPRTNERDYLLIINGNGAYSYLGRQGGEQILSYTSGYAFGSIMHELLHAAGMYHEQCRSDRDNYVRIDFQSIETGAEGNFGKFNTISSCAYDFGSIMHYSLKAFSNNGNPTIVPLVPIPTGITVGQRTTLSACDIAGIRSLYPNATGCSPTTMTLLGVKNLVNTNSGLCLAVRGATRNNGEEGTIWTYDGNADKNWNIIDVGNGFHKIQSKNSNLYLAVGAGSREDGGRVVQYQDIGQQDIYWRFIPIGEGVYKIQNKNSGKFLAIGAGLRTEGAPLVQWGDGGQEDIKWKLAEVQITGIKNLVNTNSELCLAVRGATRNNGEEGTIWNCDGNADKNWNIIDAGNGFYKIQNRNSDLYLAVGAGSRVDGGRVVQYQDIGQQDIYWRFIPIGAGVYKIQNKNSGLFLAIGAGLKTGGAPLVQWGDAGQEDIKWRLVTY